MSFKFFFPDSQDIVDPSFDFERETRSRQRVRHRDDAYAHEVLSSRAFDGILVSKGIVDGYGQGSRYTLAQRQRLLRVGVKEFFRLEGSAFGSLETMGDCGAFTYVRETVPPYTVDEVLDFYVECGFDYGISVDHVILDYKKAWDSPDASKAPQLDALKERQRLTLELAGEFWRKCRARHLKIKPIGVAQGWSPKSYAHAVAELQKRGFRYIALGGMVPLKTDDITDCLQAVSVERHPATRLHLLGISRTEAIGRFVKLGVVSLDSTSPLRQAFKDDRDNYWLVGKDALDKNAAFSAIRVPQVEGNPTLQKLISSGEIPQGRARDLERKCLRALADYDAGELALNTVLTALREYEILCNPVRGDGENPGKDRTEVYRLVLEARPWRNCGCGVCGELRHHVILFRGAERNRRRGFHNIWVFKQRLERELQRAADAEGATRLPRKTPGRRGKARADAPAQ